MLRGLVHRDGNHRYWQGKPCRQAGDRSDRQNTQLVPFTFYSHHSRSILLFSLNILRTRRTVREINLLYLVPQLEQLEEDRLYTHFSDNSMCVPVDRRFGTQFASTSYHLQPVIRTYRTPMNSLRGSHRDRPMCGVVDEMSFRTISQRSPSISQKAMAPNII